MNFFAEHYLITDRASKKYNEFIETMYYFKELNNTMTYDDILCMPFPLFNDFFMYQIKAKQKELSARKKQENEITKSAKITPKK